MTSLRQFSELPPLSLYIHIPWCVRKCPYCDFNSHTANHIPEAEYVAALINDLDHELAFVQGRPLQSIFLGGGTPSLFSAHSIAAILSAVEQRIAFASNIEITLEANPGTFEQEKFSGYHAAGVNRLSIGIQSFQQTQLEKLGRIHSSTEAIRAVHTARKAGFANVNLDLMHGLPEQSPAQAQQDLQQAIDLAPRHISWYQLTIEPNTVFYRQPPSLPVEDQLADIQDCGEQLLADSGFLQYEVSAYSQQGHTSRHNLNYWQFGDYIGIGAGAHGKNTQLSEQQIYRRWKTRTPNDYLSSANPLAGNKRISDLDLPLEFMMNSLRLNRGFELAQFSARTGLGFATVQDRIDSLIDRKLLQHTGQSIQTTALGKRFLNSVLSEFDE